MEKITFLNNLLLIFKYNKKITIFFVVIILFLNIFFETFSIGLVIPFLKSLTDENFYNVLYNFNVFGSFLLGNIFDFFQISNKNQLIIFLSIVFVVFFIFRVVMNLFTAWYIGRFKFKLHSTLSNKLFKGYLEMQYVLHLKKNSVKIINNITSEVDLFSSNAVVIITAINDIILIISIVSLLMLVQPLMTIQILFCFILIGLIFLFFTNSFINKIGQKRQNAAKQTYQHIAEGFNLIKEIQIFSKQNFFYKKFETIYHELLKIFWLRSLFPLFPRAILELTTIILLGVSLILVTNSGASLEEYFIAFSFFVAAGYRLLPSLNKLISNYQKIIFGKPAGNLVFSELKLIEKNKVQLNETDLDFKNKIGFKNVSFQFGKNDKMILDSINFEIKKNSFVGIIGESGAGKSTLVKLITGLLKPSNGKIDIDGKELELNLSSWRKKIGYVSQDLILMDEPIVKNIAFGEYDKDIDYKKVEKVISLVELSEFINNLDNGIFSLAGERGKLLSGGQIQRICIARALYRDPEILILDESTNSLDLENEKKIIKTLQKNLSHLTIIIISHRESTIMNCSETFKIKNEKVYKL